jgi:hypothetical protein
MRASTFFLLACVILYVAFPWDLFPDAWGGLGRLDDLFVIFLAVWFLWQRSSGTADGSTFQAETLSNAGPDNSQPAHQILGIPPEASPQEIKRAFKRLAAQFHPDALANTGPELQNMARQRFCEITHAYEMMMASRGNPPEEEKDDR